MRLARSGAVAACGCRFQHGVAGLGAPLRLHHDGRITSGDRVWDPEAKGLPEGSEIEMLVESGGLLRGRFLMMPTCNTHPALEQRLIAVAIADQVGTALETSFGTRP